ncbi:MAG: phosphate ABC transporter permease subunit PstC [Labilithrix sp.]|nr:phosphate ABC transporter permease subunit PstC [Labilithrix sp.]
MTQRALSTPPRLPPRSLRASVEGNGSSVDRAFGAVGAGAAGALGLVLVGVAASVARIAWPSIQATGLSFVTTSVWDPSRGTYGALAFVFGTLVTSFIALLLAVPVALGVAVFLTDLGPRRLQRPVSSLVELLAAIPSVVYGLWAALVLAPILRTTVQPALAAVGGPLFSGPNVGFGILCASLVLAIMLLPTIASVSRDVLRAVPADLREGALALGATPWDALRLVVFPHARRGIFGAVLLGFGRAIGETMAVAAVVGSRADISPSLFAPGYTMSSVIANEFPAASSELHVAALAEVGLLLFVVTVAFNVAARVLVARSREGSPRASQAGAGSGGAA